MLKCVKYLKTKNNCLKTQIKHPQVLKNINIKLKLDFTILFIYLKVILQQYFQFLTINDIIIPNRSLLRVWIRISCLRFHSFFFLPTPLTLFIRHE